MEESHKAPGTRGGTPAPPSYAGRAVTVMGLGLFGGGVGAARYLARVGARVTVTDLKPAASLRPSLKALEGLPIAFHLGGHMAKDFRGADLVVVSPAVDKRRSKFVALAQADGAEITSEMNLFFAAFPVARIVGVTGTSGKSTTTALVGDMLRAWRPTRVGGNIGRSLLEDLPKIQPDETVVLELSSFQLEDLGRLRCSPRVAIVTNISPNHLDRHETMRRYIAAKKNIVRFQGPGDVAVLNADDPRVRRWEGLVRRCGSRAVFYSARRALDEGAFADGATIVLRLDGREDRVDLAGRNPLFGRHNLQNILAAAAGARALGVPPDLVGGAVASFRPLPHRLEPIGRLGDVLFVNDSKATTPLAAKVAIEAFDRPVVVIAGGYDKHADPSPMVRAIRRRALAAVLIGATARALQKAIGRSREARQPARGGFALGEGGSGRPAVERARTLEEAVRRAAALARPDGVVLLSTGHASWDMFDNYEQRGEVFRRAAVGLGMRPLEKRG